MEDLHDRVKIARIGNTNVLLNCRVYNKGFCLVSRSFLINQNCPYKWCCCHCPDHFKCYSHSTAGCADADQTMHRFFIKEYGEGFMWANDNPEDNCPINGFTDSYWRPDED